MSDKKISLETPNKRVWKLHRETMHIDSAIGKNLEPLIDAVEEGRISVQDAIASVAVHTQILARVMNHNVEIINSQVKTIADLQARLTRLESVEHNFEIQIKHKESNNV